MSDKTRTVDDDVAVVLGAARLLARVPFRKRHAIVLELGMMAVHFEDRIAEVSAFQLDRIRQLLVELISYDVG
jgi:hypothetical protein